MKLPEFLRWCEVQGIKATKATLNLPYTPEPLKNSGDCYALHEVCGDNLGLRIFIDEEAVSEAYLFYEISFFYDKHQINFLVSCLDKAYEYLREKGYNVKNSYLYRLYKINFDGEDLDYKTLVNSIITLSEKEWMF